MPTSGKTAQEYRDENPKVSEIPFNSSNKWQMSIHNLSPAASGVEGKKHILYLKGGADVVLLKCSRYIDGNGVIQPMEESIRATFMKRYETFGGGGERVLAFAYRPMPMPLDEELALDAQYLEKLKTGLVGKESDTAIMDLIFVGLITLMDPPRDAVPQAVKDCHTAGVKVVK